MMEVTKKSSSSNILIRTELRIIVKIAKIEKMVKEETRESRESNTVTIKEEGNCIRDESRDASYSSSRQMFLKNLRDDEDGIKVKFISRDRFKRRRKRNIREDRRIGVKRNNKFMLLCSFLFSSLSSLSSLLSFRDTLVFVVSLDDACDDAFTLFSSLSSSMLMTQDEEMFPLNGARDSGNPYCLQSMKGFSQTSMHCLFILEIFCFFTETFN